MLKLKRRQQNQKFPFHSFRLAAEGWGEEPRKKMQGNFWVCPRESASAAEAQSERTLQFRVGTRSERAKWVRAKANISPQIETSSGVRAAAQSAAAEWAGRKPRREAAKVKGAA